jgi:hypothetical protein
MNDEIKLLDVVVLITDLPKYNLRRGEVGTVVECHPHNAFEVEFVAQDGRTYALATIRTDQLIPLRRRRNAEPLREDAEEIGP